MKCPLCGSPKLKPSGDRDHFCLNCRHTVNCEDDGDYSDRRPDIRIERAERQRERMQSKSRRY